MSVLEAAWWVFLGAWAAWLAMAALYLAIELRRVRRLLASEGAARRARSAQRAATSGDSRF